MAGSSADARIARWSTGAGSVGARNGSPSVSSTVAASSGCRRVTAAHASSTGAGPGTVSATATTYADDPPPVRSVNQMPCWASVMGMFISRFPPCRTAPATGV